MREECHWSFVIRHLRSTLDRAMELLNSPMNTLLAHLAENDRQIGERVPELSYQLLVVMGSQKFPSQKLEVTSN